MQPGYLSTGISLWLSGKWDQLSPRSLGIQSCPALEFSESPKSKVFIVSSWFQVLHYSFWLPPLPVSRCGLPPWRPLVPWPATWTLCRVLSPLKSFMGCLSPLPPGVPSFPDWFPAYLPCVYIPLCVHMSSLARHLLSFLVLSVRSSLWVPPLCPSTIYIKECYFTIHTCLHLSLHHKTWQFTWVNGWLKSQI